MPNQSKKCDDDEYTNYNSLEKAHTVSNVFDHTLSYEAT